MLVLFGAALMIAVPSCKKGVNDPGLSLKHRKSRLAGEYNITNKEDIGTSISGGSTTIYKTTFDGTTVTKIVTANDGTTTTTIPVSVATWTINKDGSWEKNGIK